MQSTITSRPSWPHFLARALSTCVGTLIVAAAAYAIVTMKAQDVAHAMITYGLAAGIVVGGIAISHMKGAHKALLVVALLAGEAFNVGATFQRVTAERFQAKIETARLAAKAAQDAADKRAAWYASKDYHETAVKRVSAAESALQKAEENRARDAKEKYCRAECSKMHKEAVQASQAELAEARHDLDQTPAPATAEPVEVKLPDMPEDDPRVDVAMAALASIAVNGLGMVLLAFGCHAAKPVPARLPANDSAPANVPTFSKPAGPQGPKGKRKTSPQFPANVVPISGKHPVIASLENNGGSVASNRELARLMRVTDGEATKRVSEVAHLLTIRKLGKAVTISLRREAAA